MIDAIRQHPISFLLCVLYMGNVCWYLVDRKWGLGLYWFSALLINFAVTWARDWKG